jgi:hypothetical protein
MCDWCGEALYRVDYAKMAITIQRVKGTYLERKWAEEVEVTRHFCVAPKVDRNRMGLEAEDDDRSDSCYGRAIAAITGMELEQPDMGMEWRLVPTATSTPFVPLSDEMRIQFQRLTPRAQSALNAKRITTVEQIDARSDDHLLAIEGVGIKSVRILRQIADMLRETAVA